MNQSLANKLVLCDLDNLLLGPDGNLTQVVRDVLQLFSSRGGRFTVFSQRTPKAVRAILGSVRLSAPALVCGGTLAYHFADGSRQPLCSFAGQDAGLFASLPSAAGVGIALQMQDGSTRVLRMSHALEQHLQQEWTPYLLANVADIRPDEVLRALVYQDNRSIPLTSLLEKALGDSTTALNIVSNLIYFFLTKYLKFSIHMSRIIVHSNIITYTLINGLTNHYLLEEI